MTRYSNEFKNRVLRKVLPPESRSAEEVGREEHIHPQTIRTWMKQLKHGTLEAADGEISPASRSASEKITLVLESKRIAPENMGHWLREQGLHSEHLTVWEQELREAMQNKETTQKSDMKNLKKENAQLKKELERKEKALAEIAALLVLKKKAEALWGDNEDD